MAQAEDASVEYIRSDVFEAKMDAFMAEVRLGNANLLDEVHKGYNQLQENINGVKTEFREEMTRGYNQLQENINSVKTELYEEILDTRGDIKALNARFDSLQTSVYWGFTVMALVIALLTLSPALGEFFRSFRRPSVTMEDVERAIDAAIQKALSPERN